MNATDPWWKLGVRFPNGYSVSSSEDGLLQLSLPSGVPPVVRCPASHADAVASLLAQTHRGLAGVVIPATPPEAVSALGPRKIAPAPLSPSGKQGQGLHLDEYFALLRQLNAPFRMGIPLHIILSRNSHAKYEAQVCAWQKWICRLARWIASLHKEHGQTLFNVTDLSDLPADEAKQRFKALHKVETHILALCHNLYQPPPTSDSDPDIEEPKAGHGGPNPGDDILEVGRGGKLTLRDLQTLQQGDHLRLYWTCSSVQAKLHLGLRSIHTTDTMDLSPHGDQLVLTALLTWLKAQTQSLHPPTNEFVYQEINRLHPITKWAASSPHDPFVVTCALLSCGTAGNVRCIQGRTKAEGSRHLTLSGTIDGSSDGLAAALEDVLGKVEEEARELVWAGLRGFDALLVGATESDLVVGVDPRQMNEAARRWQRIRRMDSWILVADADGVSLPPTSFLQPGCAVCVGDNHPISSTLSEFGANRTLLVAEAVPPPQQHQRGRRP